LSRIEFRTLVSLEDARKALLPFYRREKEEVQLSECHGRALACDVYSKVDVPGFDRASMDGYAVKSGDTWGADEESPKTLKVTGIVNAGDRPSAIVEKGTAVEVATGAMMPEGANAVVMVENTDPEGDGVEQCGRVNVRKPVSPGENVMHAGTDVMMGELVLKNYVRLTPREVSVLAAVGLEWVPVYKKPRVGIMSTGNEIRPPGAALEPGQVYDVNAYSVGAGVVENGGEPVYLVIIGDTRQEFLNALAEAIGKVDVLVTSGSTSAGASDMMFSAVGDLGKVLVHGIKVKPGKPTIIGEYGGKPFIGLPGYPSSAMTIFSEVVAPLVRYMGGQAERSTKEVKATMALRVTSEGGREVLLPVGLTRTSKGLAAYPVEKGSGSISQLLDADGYVEVGEDTQMVPEGDEVSVRLFSEEIAFPDLLVIGSHCLGVDVITAMMSEKGYTVRSINVGSMGGLRAIRKNVADVAGIHLLSEAGVYNEPFIRDMADAVLVKGYVREQGIIVAPGNPLGIRGIEDLPGKRFINRTKGSGTRTLLDMELKKLATARGESIEAITGSMPGYDVEAKTHNAVALAVKMGRADAGLGIRTVAGQNGLGFIPLRDEEYDFVIRKSRLGEPGVSAFLGVLHSGEFRRRIEALGYHTIQTK
jgi:putative molybdopterin biosynthesis protein